MGNKTGKFEVTHEDKEVKKETVTQEQVDEIVAEKVEQTEAAPAIEVTENGETETKTETEVVTDAKTEEVADVTSNDAEHKVEATEVTEPKKKSVLGWLKKISFRKEKKLVKTEESAEKEVEKTEDAEENKEVETPVEVTTTEVVEKSEEIKPEETVHEEVTNHIEEEEVKKVEE